ncbi:hypothetical protein AAG570_001826 [Ranatra chinensis]|uniref:Uncharacterized protein n=1 Tax=Ranatra chinensis TaxID=642074 RepID=A0ABD0Y9W5_9HEMI
MVAGHNLNGSISTTCFAGYEPEFAEPLTNLTVAVGREATFRCVVDHLGGYRGKASMTELHRAIDDRRGEEGDEMGQKKVVGGRTLNLRSTPLIVGNTSRGEGPPIVPRAPGYCAPDVWEPPIGLRLARFNASSSLPSWRGGGGVAGGGGGLFSIEGCFQPPGGVGVTSPSRLFNPTADSATSFVPTRVTFKATPLLSCPNNRNLSDFLCKLLHTTNNDVVQANSLCVL